jgi:hypothetical protein
MERLQHFPILDRKKGKFRAVFVRGADAGGLIETLKL